ncbi:MAG TPA: DUF4097 family beta strand repeat-containing protein [Ktedonobacteraceae bacterium]|nr:DUF4097 family beta strand repeat-containing protein [Ktedonobacteraceae bacterium]
MLNEQEMQFADPDWKPTGTLLAPSNNGVANAPTPVPVVGQTNNQAYDGQAPGALPAYDQGYQGVWQEPQPVMQPPSLQQPFMPPYAQQTPYRQAGAMRGRGRSRWWIWVIVAIIFVSMMSGGAFSFSHRSHSGLNPYPKGPAPMQQQQIYSMKGAAELDINDLSGNVTIQVATDGNPNLAVITGDGSQPAVNYQGQKVVLTSDSDITVTVPQSVALNLGAGQSNIEVDNFSGQLTAQTNSGDIMLNNDNLSQGSSLNTNTGNIDLESGTVADVSIISVNGTITMGQVGLSGKVAVSTGGNGSISYNGILDSQGKYQFTTDSGDIDLTMPADTSMQLKVSQKGGHYNSDFPASTGSAPQASVGVTTNSGNITISKQ